MVTWCTIFRTGTSFGRRILRSQIAFSQKTYATTLASVFPLAHPVSSTLPDEITIHAGTEAFSRFDGIETPGLEQYLTVPAPPILKMHVSTFTDATMIGFYAPHTFNDATAFLNLLRGWAATSQLESILLWTSLWTIILCHLIQFQVPRF